MNDFMNNKNTVHKFKFIQVRRMAGPGKPNIVRFIGDVKFEDLPEDISAEPNVRTTDDLDTGRRKKVYQKVKETADQQEENPFSKGLFGYRNQGITILAKEVTKIGDNEYRVRVPKHDISFGILDGKHSYNLIHETRKERIDNGLQVPDEHVTVKIIMGCEPEESQLIAEGLNTTMQVAEQSLINNRNGFDWIKNVFKDKTYEKKIAYTENEIDKDVDIRDIVTLINCLNMDDYPLTSEDYTHPIQSYTSKSTVLRKYQNETEKFKKAEYILTDILKLYDTIRHDWPIEDKKDGARTGGKRYVDNKSKGKYNFPFIDKKSDNRLSKGCAMAILSAFRVLIEEKNGKYQWVGGFDNVERIWKKAIPRIVKTTRREGENQKNNPQSMAKNDGFWDKLVIQLSMISDRTEIWEIVE